MRGSSGGGGGRGPVGGRGGGGRVGEQESSRGQHGARVFMARSTPRPATRATATLPPRAGAGGVGADGVEAWGGAARPEGLGRLPGGRGGATRVAWTAWLRPSGRAPEESRPLSRRGVQEWGGCWARVRVACLAGAQTPCTPALIPGAHGPSAIWMRVVAEMCVARRAAAGGPQCRAAARASPTGTPPPPSTCPAPRPPPPPARRAAAAAAAAAVPKQRALVGVIAAAEAARRRRRTPPKRTPRPHPHLPSGVSAVTRATSMTLLDIARAPGCKFAAPHNKTTCRDHLLWLDPQILLTPSNHEYFLLILFLDS